MKGGEIITHNLYEEDKEQLRKLFHNALQSSRYTLNDLQSMDFGELLEIVELISRDVQAKIDAAKKQ